MTGADHGTVGGRYQLGELLGRGGMAEVRKGVDSRLGRVVAVKRLRTDLASDSTFQARFRREAQSSASLNHPAIVAVYDTGEETTADGISQPYIVMEYVAGRTLRDILREGRKILPERALEITSGVLSALDYSHRAGIIHRDIKPGNVMLTPTGDVKVMDFGIARAVSDAASSMTQTAAVVGTAQYLSPEQARGESVDSRSDVYSAGCLLYELLTGRPPFVGDSAVAVAYQHVREPAVPPSHHDSDLTPAIDAIVMKALAKRVEDRYQSAAHMRTDIERYLGGQPVTVTAPPVPPPTPTTSVMATPSSDDTAVRPAASPTTRRDDDDDRRSGATVWVVLVLLLAALVTAALLAWSELFPDEPTDVQVPSVVGMELESARLAIAEEGLEPDHSEACSDEFAAGQVSEQDPPGDEYVDPESSVDIVVSTGPCDFPMPSVRDLRADAAIQVLVGDGLQRRNITVRAEECDTDEPKGTVVEQDPEAGDPVRAQDTVVLCTSDGPEEVPDVVGLRQGEAERLITEAGFNPVVEEEDDTTAPAGEVVRQTPAAEETRPQDTDVVIFVSTFEPEEEPTDEEPTDPDTSVPPPDNGGGDDGGTGGGGTGGGGGRGGGDGGGGGQGGGNGPNNPGPIHREVWSYRTGSA
ncbi:MAG TPA: Stk1 family PASTA domain-containing Ser/Thr kinase [Nocardioides sp.]|nr:Stk1 family PASTA domain-containing Ser/Thr kinase [Nocardioides sp.]